MLQRFFWLVDGALAGCSRPGMSPGKSPSAGPDGTALSQDLTWLRAQGIGAVLSLTETSLPAETLAEHGLAMLHLPVPDLQPPAPDQFMAALGFIDRQRSLGRAVAVHCLAGQGRTGAVLAAYLIRQGSTSVAALAEVRARCPGAVSSDGQERALHRFAESRDWIL